MNRDRMQDINSRLKKCPFCGGRASIDYSRVFVSGESTKAALVYCTACHSHSPKFDGRNYLRLTDAYDDAVNAWNRRSGA